MVYPHFGGQSPPIVENGNDVENEVENVTGEFVIVT